MAVTYSQNGVIVKQADNYRIIGGREYRTVVMPDGKEWLAENLDFKFCTIGGGWSSQFPIAWYYNNDETTYGWNGYKCGLLYNWHAVKMLNDNRADLCPGWHVPTSAELENLFTLLGGMSVAATSLKALDDSAGTNWPSNWNGTDDYGFAILPAGINNNGTYVNVRSGSNFWTISSTSSTLAPNYEFSSEPSINTFDYHKTSGFSLRLVRDAT